MKWDSIVFGNLYSIESRNGLTKPSKIRGEGFKMLNMGELFANDRIYDISMELVPLNENEKKSAKIEKGDLLFARQSLVLEGAGKCSIVMDVSPLTVFESHIIRVRLNQEIANPLFYYYYFRSPYSSIKSIVSQCAQAGIRGIDLQKIEVIYPPKDTQCRVANILSAYDNLVENNQKQIKLLEEAAQRLYKEWFVDLRFPGHEQTKIVDGVPEGWKKCCIGDLISYEIGGGWGEETPTNNCIEEAYVIRGTDLYNVKLGRFEDIPCRFHSKSNLNSRRLCDGDIIFEVSGGSKNTGAGRSLLIRTEILNLLKLPVMCASFCKLIRLEDNQLSQYFYDFLQYCKNNGITEKYDMRSASSIVNYRWKDFLTQEKILMPPNEILKYYSNFAEANYHKMMNCALQINLLQNARDRLLPKLMNGEIEL